MLVLWDVCRAQRQQQIALYTYYNKIHNRPSVLKKKKKKKKRTSPGELSRTAAILSIACYVWKMGCTPYCYELFS